MGKLARRVLYRNRDLNLNARNRELSNTNEAGRITPDSVNMLGQ